MPFDHEMLDVYGLAVDFVSRAKDVVEALPRGRGYLADQLQRAALSIVLNIAEGAGKFSGDDDLDAGLGRGLGRVHGTHSMLRRA